MIVLLVERSSLILGGGSGAAYESPGKSCHCGRGVTFYGQIGVLPGVPHFADFPLTALQHAGLACPEVEAEVTLDMKSSALS